MKTGKIRTGQLIMLLFTAQCAVLLPARSPRALLTALPAALLCAGILLLPVTRLVCTPELGALPARVSECIGTDVGSVVAVLYGLYFLFEGALSVSGLGRFVQTTALPDGSAAALGMLVVLAALYGAWMGIESTARTAGLIGVFLLLVLAVTVGILFRQLNFRSFTPSELVEDGAVLSVGRDFCAGLGGAAALLALLGPWVKGGRPRGAAGFLLASGAFAGCIALCASGVLGTWAESRPYPLYTAATSVPTGTLVRPDALYTVLITAAVYVRAAVFLIGFALCMRSLPGAGFQRAALPVGAAGMGALTVWMLQAQNASAAANEIRWMPALLFGALLPLALLAAEALLYRKKVRS